MQLEVTNGAAVPRPMRTGHRYFGFLMPFSKSAHRKKSGSANV